VKAKNSQFSWIRQTILLVVYVRVLTCWVAVKWIVRSLCYSDSSTYAAAAPSLPMESIDPKNNRVSSLYQTKHLRLYHVPSKSPHRIFPKNVYNMYIYFQVLWVRKREHLLVAPAPPPTRTLFLQKSTRGIRAIFRIFEIRGKSIFIPRLTTTEVFNDQKHRIDMFGGPRRFWSETKNSREQDLNWISSTSVI